MSAASSVECGCLCPMEIQSEANVVIASQSRDAMGEVRLDRRDQQPSNRSDQIDRVIEVCGVGLTCNRVGCALIVHLQPALSTHCGNLVFPGKWQSGVKKQAAGGQCRRMPSIENSTDDFGREECKPQQSGRVGTVDILAARDEFEAGFLAIAARTASTKKIHACAPFPDLERSIATGTPCSIKVHLDAPTSRCQCALSKSIARNRTR